MSDQVHSDGYKCRGAFCSHGDHGPAVSRAEELDAREVEFLVSGPEYICSANIAQRIIRELESDRAALLAIVREYFLWIRCSGISGMRSVNKLIVSLPEALKKEVTGG